MKSRCSRGVAKSRTWQEGSCGTGVGPLGTGSLLRSIGVSKESRRSVGGAASAAGRVCVLAARRLLQSLGTSVCCVACVTLDETSGAHAGAGGRLAEEASGEAAMGGDGGARLRPQLAAQLTRLGIRRHCDGLRLGFACAAR